MFNYIKTTKNLEAKISVAISLLLVAYLFIGLFINALDVIRVILIMIIIGMPLSKLLNNLTIEQNLFNTCILILCKIMIIAITFILAWYSTGIYGVAFFICGEIGSLLNILLLQYNDEYRNNKILFKFFQDLRKLCADTDTSNKNEKLEYGGILKPIKKNEE